MENRFSSGNQAYLTYLTSGQPSIEQAHQRFAGHTARMQAIPTRLLLFFNQRDLEVELAASLATTSPPAPPPMTALSIFLHSG
jgi:hypothetical protein